MSRAEMILIRGYAPSTVPLVGAVFVLAWLRFVPASPLTDGIISLVSWAPLLLLLLAIGIALAASATVRIARWRNGVGPACTSCGGPLGAEREGRPHRGGHFRRCYACGKAVNHRHYD